MKNFSFPATLIVGLILAMLAAYVCPACEKTSAQTKVDPPPAETGYSVPIPVDSANEMIQSYLDGIDYTHNTNEIRALVCNADSLRVYLNDPSVKNVKLYFAHNMAWINSGHKGERPGPNQNALTIIIVGLDSLERFVPIHNTRGTAEIAKVLDRLDPCPDDCMGATLIE